MQCVFSRSAQFAASEFLGQILAIFKNEETSKFHEKLRKLFESNVGWMKFSHSLCFQLKGKAITEATVDQLAKNLLFLSNQIQDDEEFDNFTQIIAKVCAAEVVHFPTESVRVSWLLI